MERLRMERFRLPLLALVAADVTELVSSAVLRETLDPFASAKDPNWLFLDRNPLTLNTFLSFFDNDLLLLMDISDWIETEDETDVTDDRRPVENSDDAFVPDDMVDDDEEEGREGLLSCKILAVLGYCFSLRDDSSGWRRDGGGPVGNALACAVGDNRCC